MRPTDLQFAGGSASLRFTYSLDGFLSGDLGTILSFGIDKIVNCPSGNSGCFTTVRGSGVFNVNAFRADGTLLSPVTSLGSSVTIFPYLEDVNIDGTVLFTFPVGFNSFQTFTRGLNVYAGSAGARTDFFYTLSLTNVEALESDS